VRYVKEIREYSSLSHRGGTRIDTRSLHVGFMVNKGHCDRFSPSTSVFFLASFIQLMFYSHYFYVADAVKS
jgi:hypothetical protein